MELFETMRLEHGCLLRETYHRNRIKQACAHLKVDFDETVWSEHIHHLEKEFHEGIYRVKIIVDEIGEIRCEHAILRESEEMTACLKQVDNSTPTWQRIFKTTERDYLKHAHHTQLILLFDDTEKVLEFDIGNVVVEYGGHYYTPPYANDFLRGCMRQSLLDQGEIELKLLNVNLLKQFLNQGGKLWMINSLRGWVPVKLSDI